MLNWTGKGEYIDIVAANNDVMAIDAAIALAGSKKKVLVGGINAAPHIDNIDTLIARIRQNG